MFGAIDLGILERLHKRVLDEDIRFSISIYQANGKRYAQEDRYVSIYVLEGHLVALFDGHGGGRAAERSNQLLPGIFEEEYSKFWNKIGSRNEIGPKEERKIIRRAVLKLVKKMEYEDSGTTLSLAYARPIGRDENGQRKILLTTAVMGDSPVAIFNGKRTQFMPMHSAKTHESDKKEIAAKHNVNFSNNYVWRGQEGLAMTRSLGDQYFGDKLVRRPDLRSFELTTDAFVVVATDGIFTHQQFENERKEIRNIVKQIKAGSDAENIGKAMGITRDNLTLAVMRFDEGGCHED